jgi:hypothetical protein
LLREVFCYGPERSKYTSIQDWIGEANQHPEWLEDNADTRQKVRRTGFSHSLTRYLLKQNVSRRERKRLTDLVFGRKPKTLWSYFETIADWIEEKRKHTEWSATNKNRCKDKQYRVFYQAAYDWIKIQKISADKKKEMLHRLNFGPLRTDWSVYKTIDDWFDERKKHPTWEKQTANKDSINFYRAFNNWLDKREIPAFKKRNLLLKLVNLNAPKKANKYLPRYAGYKTIEDWIERYKKHPAWRALNETPANCSAKLIRVRRQAQIFSQAFLEWLEMQGFSPEKKEELKHQLFHPKEYRPACFTTLSDWKKEARKHPDWRNKTVTEMRQTAEGNTFFRVLNEWLNAHAENVEEKLKMFKQVARAARRQY